MGLVDFMQKLQEQDSDIIYSEKPEQNIKIIPPEKSSVGIKIIPPEETIVQQSVKIKLKLKNPQQRVNTKEETKTETTQTIESPSIEQSKPVPIEQPKQEQPKEIPTKVEKSEVIVPKPEDLSIDTMFMNSGTEISKKSIWVEQYQKAKASRKQNDIVSRMKLGKFTITPDNKVFILPDYDVVNKDPDDILKEHWM